MSQYSSRHNVKKSPISPCKIEIFCRISHYFLSISKFFRTFAPANSRWGHFASRVGFVIKCRYAVLRTLYSSACWHLIDIVKAFTKRLFLTVETWETSISNSKASSGGCPWCDYTHARTRVRVYLMYITAWVSALLIWLQGFLRTSTADKQ